MSPDGNPRDLSTVAQDYLKVIWTAQEWSLEKVSTKMLAERIGVSASTASESIRKLADQGLAIIFASSDNQEVLGLADTVATFFRGRIVRVSPATEMEHSSLLRDVTHPETLAAGREAA